MPTQVTGDCYRQALEYCLDHQNVILVHGEIHIPDGRTFLHAWTEKDNIMQDTQGPWSIEQFYKMTNPTIHHKYTCDEAIILALCNGHYGPWE